MKRSRISACLVVLSLLGGSSSVSAASTADPDPSALVSATEALREDIEAYAKSFKVDVTEAEIQTAEVGTIANLQTRLEHDHPDTFGGLWIEHEPYGVVVATTENGGEELRDLASQAGLSVVPEIRVVGHSYASLRALGAELAAIDLGPVNLAVNIVTNTVDVETTAKARVDAAIRGTRVTSPAIRILELSSIGEPTVNMYGGLGGSANNWSGCMSAFTVERTITGGVIESGIVTAGHCGNTLSYQNVNLPMVADWHQTDADAQWHTTPTFSDVPEFIYNEAQARRFVTAPKTRSSMVVGESVCKYGRATGYDCGTIDIKDFRPNPFDCCWVNNPSFTFIRAQNCNVDLAQGGDSGGPVFWGNTAYGVVSGKEVDIFCGGRTKLIFTAMDLALSHFSGLRVKVR